MIAATGQKLTHTVAVRLSDEQSILLDALRTTFPSNAPSEALRWVLDEPRVRQVIAERVRG